VSDGRTTFLDALREHLGLTGTRKGDSMSMSLNAIATPAAREWGFLVTRWL
jgi:hypothetical protein